MKIKKKYVICIILIMLIFSIALLLNLKDNNKKIFSIENIPTPITNSELPKDDLVQFAEDYNINPDNVKKFEINDKFANYYSIKDNKSLIVNTITQDTVSIEKLIINGKEEEFKNLIIEQINIKYPLFIANELALDTTTKNYVFDNSGIIINFSNFNTNPVYEKEAQIKLTCDMLDNILSMNCNINYNKNPNVVELDPTKKTVVLTFDDGPNNNTLRVLKILNDNKTTATFFMLGSNMRNFPRVLKEVSETDNEIASHTYSHKSLTKLTESELKYELSKPDEILKELTDKNISYIRPPYGNVNSNVKTLANKPLILWSVDPQDWRFRNGEVVSQNILNDISDGDIILLHDIHSTTADALELVLPQLYVEGYQVVSVGKLAELKGIKLENGLIYRNFK